jgi:hypothetical protein
LNARVMLFNSGVKNARLWKPYAKLKRRRFNTQRVRVMLLGFSSQGPHDRLIGIEPHIRGLLLGMRAGGHGDS